MTRFLAIAAVGGLLSWGQAIAQEAAGDPFAMVPAAVVRFSDASPDIQAFIRHAYANGGAGIAPCAHDPEALTLSVTDADGVPPLDHVLEVNCPVLPPLVAPLYWVWIGQDLGGYEFETRQAPFHAPQVAASNSSWLRRPRGSELAAVLPQRALNENVDGRTAMSCAVDAEGYLHDCHIVREEPQGYGFGTAALALAPHFRLNLAVVSAPGGRVEVPVTWRFPRD